MPCDGGHIVACAPAQRECMVRSMTHPRHPGSAEVARLVREEITRQGLQRAEIAVAIGLTDRALRRRIHCETEFSVGEILKVADALGVPVGDLFPTRQEAR